MPHWNNQPWQRNLSKIASGKPGAVQKFKHRVSHTLDKSWGQRQWLYDIRVIQTNY